MRDGWRRDRPGGRMGDGGRRKEIFDDEVLGGNRSFVSPMTIIPDRV